MAIQEHVEVVKQGAAAIVQWRARNPDTRLDLHGANLRKVDLSGADLRWANLCEANLREANLCEANLCEANLREVDLSGANLYEANLYGANLRVANLRKVDLSGAGAIWSCGPGGSRYDMCYFVQHDHGLMVNCGCFWGTLAEFEAAVEEGHGDNEYGRYYRAVIEAAKAWQS